MQCAALDGKLVLLLVSYVFLTCLAFWSFSDSDFQSCSLF